MLKRRAAGQRGIRWAAGGIAAAVLGLAVVWALFVPVADSLAHHDVGSAAGTLHETALDNARGRLLTLGAGLLAAGALVFTARNFWLSREGQVTDRYTKAIEQLGSDKLDVRIGGIYALERIARDSARDHPAVMEVLTAFIREHSREPWRPEGPDGAQPEPWIRPDVQAAVTVVGRRDRKRDLRVVDVGDASLIRANLASADLSGAKLYRCNLASADLTGADLTGADLRAANLAGAYLHGANLAGAALTLARLQQAWLTDAVLTSADLVEAKLLEATLDKANLAGADLTRANLAGANLFAADLTRGILQRADLTSADITDTIFAHADLSGAKWPKDAEVPEGWKLDARSGRRQRRAPALTRGNGAPPRPRNRRLPCLAAAVLVTVERPQDRHPVLRGAVAGLVRADARRRGPLPHRQRALGDAKAAGHRREADAGAWRIGRALAIRSRPRGESGPGTSSGPGVAEAVVIAGGLSDGPGRSPCPLILPREPRAGQRCPPAARTRNDGFNPRP